jgi:hypothetical protein
MPSASTAALPRHYHEASRDGSNAGTQQLARGQAPMTRRGLRGFLCVLVASLSCHGSRALPAPRIRTDPAELREKVDLQFGNGPERWVTLPRGTVGLGPTDVEVYACVSLDEAAWRSFDARSAPSTSGGRLRVPEDLAAELFDASRLGMLPQEDDARIVEGPPVDLARLTKMPYRGAGVRLGDALVLHLWTT